MDRLSTKVSAQNLAGKLANEMHPKLQAIFKPLAGRKVCKVDGPLVKRVAEQLPPYNLDKLRRCQFFQNLHHSTYAGTTRPLSFTVKACVSDGGMGCSYAEVSVYVCDILDGVVCESGTWYGPPNCRTDYTPEAVTEARKVYEQKQREAQDARSALEPFGTSDR